MKIAEAMPVKTRGVFLLSMQTGVRVSDAIAAKAGDFDAKGFFHYKARKTGKDGRAPVTPDFIAEYVAGLFPDEWLFKSPTKLGEHITRQTVFLHVKKACKKLHIDATGIAPHTARKAFAVDLFHREGLGKTMHALQHRDAATTLLYALSDDPMPDTLKRLDRLEKQLSELREMLEALSDRVCSDDRYIPTDRKQYKIVPDES